MPEGDTIFRAARTLQRALAGQIVTRFETQYAQIARVHDDAPITGRTVEQVEARGKHLLMWFSAPRAEVAIVSAGPVILRTHMMMSGSWHIYRIGEPWQRSSIGARLVVGTATYVAVGFNVPVAEFIAQEELETSEAIVRLGPDVLGVEFDDTDAAARLARSDRGTAADALLDQRAVAGIGNVFKSELLFLAKVWPFLPPDRVSPDQWSRMARDARTLLRANVVDPAAAGVFTYRGNRRTTGRTNPGQSLYVYGRHRQPCRRCGTAILMRHHGEHHRSTYWCPKCQFADA